MSPSWYDLLGVERDATADEIRAAWKAAIADLEPGERRFRTLNTAAEVLLDPERRAAYDAELEAAEEPEPSPEPSYEPEAEPARSAPSDAAAGRSVPGWLLALLAAATLLAVAGAVTLLVLGDDADVVADTRAARAAAERAIVPVLSYDHATLEDDQERAQSYLTSGYRKEYDQTFGLVAENAPELEAVVTAELVSSGIVRSGEDRVQVLVFVDQVTTNKQTSEPVTYQNHVTVTMQQVDGEWLIDDLRTQG